ncbi:MAG: hypothetical protein GY940_18475, partial [bacterium]|nr:hypothetical protein [bacterium]
FALTEMARKLSIDLFSPAHRVKERQDWLKDISETFNLVDKLSPRKTYIKVGKQDIIIESDKKNNKPPLYRISWREGGSKQKVDEHSTDDSFEDIARSFFRSYDDGLAEYPDSDADKNSRQVKKASPKKNNRQVKKKSSKR